MIQSGNWRVERDTVCTGLVPAKSTGTGPELQPKFHWNQYRSGPEPEPEFWLGPKINPINKFII